MAMENQAERDKTKYFSKLALSHMDAMRLLKKGKVIGAESEGWRNVGEHNLLGGVTAHTLGRLVGLSETDLKEVTNAGLTHDWEKRLEKEATAQQKKNASDRVLIETDVAKTIAAEAGKTGLARVTGIDLSDIETWGVKEKIIRYMDSCLGTDADTGKAHLENYHNRFDDLRRRLPAFDVAAGEHIYGRGVKLFDKQEEVTQQVEAELFTLVLQRNAELSQKFSSPSDLLVLVENEILSQAGKH